MVKGESNLEAEILITCVTEYLFDNDFNDNKATKNCSIKTGSNRLVKLIQWRKGAD